MKALEGQRPVVSASRVLGAIAAVAGVIPILGSAFGWFEWSVEQLEAYTVAVGAIVGAVALALGIQVEKSVTPVSNPSDGASPLVPTANDGYEDPEIWVEED